MDARELLFRFVRSRQETLLLSTGEDSDDEDSDEDAEDADDALLRHPKPCSLLIKASPSCSDAII